MFEHLVSRDGDIPARRPFEEDRRSGNRRRCSPPFHMITDRRRRVERRLDTDWRYAVIRQWMADRPGVPS